MEFTALVVSLVALVVSIGTLVYVSRALNEVVRTAIPDGSASSPPAQAQFRLQHVSPHHYVLHNDGTASAWNVRVEPGGLVVHEGPTAIDVFPPGHAQEYLFLQPMQARVAELVVTWRDQDNDIPRMVALPLEPVDARDDAEQD